MTTMDKQDKQQTNENKLMNTANQLELCFRINVKTANSCENVICRIYQCKALTEKKKEKRKENSYLTCVTSLTLNIASDEAFCKLQYQQL